MPPPVQIAYRPIDKPKVGHLGYAGFNPHTQYFKKGDRPFGRRQVDCDITMEHDVEIKVRDGCRLYVDICRPTNPKGPVAAVLSYSPFGKKFTGVEMLDFAKSWLPFRCGVGENDISGLEKFEGLDPAMWCAWDYAIVSVDARGAGDSDGAVVIMGTQEGEDGYDVCEAVAAMPWCNGSVGTAGNSHLGIVQWFIAQQHPPSLKAIAPWEACSDLYREQFVRGGIFSMSNFEFIVKTIIQGGVGCEDFREMYRRTNDGLINSYWADKRANMKSITTPAFITGSEFSAMHTMGSVRGYMELGTEDKWLRWSAGQEWYDIWAVPAYNEELKEFFDFFLKGIQNGWREKTPKTRMSILQFGKKEAIKDFPIPDFPLPDTDYKPLYLSSGGKLAVDSPAETEMVEYDSEDPTSSVSFQWTFDKTTTLCGLPKAILYMSCDKHDDFALSVQLRKLDPSGKPLLSMTIPFKAAGISDPEESPRSGVVLHAGAIGLLRASHRAIDHSRSMHPQFPFHPHDRLDKVPPGTVVKMEIGIFMTGVRYEAGESIRVDIRPVNPLIMPDTTTAYGEPLPGNIGKHQVHFGGKYRSCVILPFTNL